MVDNYLIVRDPFHPHTSREFMPLEPGMTLHDIDVPGDNPYIILVDGEAVLREQWDRLIDDEFVTVVVLPQGGDGGSNPLKIVLMVVVAAAAAYTGGAAFGAAGYFGTSAVGASLVSTGVMIAGSMLVNALVPVASLPSSMQMAQMSSPSPTYDLQAQGNSARLGGAIPVQYGRMAFYPDFAAMPYAEYSGNDQYLYQLLCLGCGTFSIEGIYIEDTPVSTFPEITYEVIQPHGPCTLFPSNVITSVEVSGQELLTGASVGPYVANPANTTANFIGVDFIMPKGLYYANDAGGLGTVSIVVVVYAQMVDINGVPYGSEYVLGSEVFSGATNTPQRRSCRYSVTAARWQVRCVRTDTKQTDARYGHDVHWIGLRAYLPSVSDYGNVTLLALRMKASNSLSSQSSRKVKVIATAKTPIWNGTAWSAATANRSIAWAIADALRNADYGAGQADSRIDLAGLLTLDAFWAARGDYFDARFDSSITMWEAIGKIAGAGRAIAFNQGGVCRVARDSQQHIPVAMFSMRNIIKGSFSVEYLMPTENSADAVDVEYFDAATWSSRVVRAALTGSLEKNVATVNLFGVTSRDRVYENGLYTAAASKRRRKVIKFSTEMGGFIPSPLDLIVVQHGMSGWGQSAEVVAVDIVATKPIYTLNEVLEWGTGTHYVAIRKDDNSVDGPWPVTQYGGDPSRVALASTPATVINTGLTGERTQIIFGEAEAWRQPAKVVAVRPRGLYQVDIECVAEDDSVHTADQGMTAPPLVTSDLVTRYTVPVIADLQVVVGGGPLGPELRLSWRPAAGAEYYVIDSSPDGSNWTREADTAAASMRITVEAGVVHVRVAAVGNLTTGPYLEWSGDLTSYLPPPAPPTNLALEQPFVGRSCKISWTGAARADLHRIEVRAGGTLKRTIDIVGTRYQYTEEDATADGGPWRSVNFRVYGMGNGVSVEYASLDVSNPQVAALAGVTFIPGYLQIIAAYLLPADTDFQGVIVAMSKTDGFVPAETDYVYDGPDKLFVLQKDPNGVSFANGETWYFRIAGYDKFGKDALIWSSQHFVTIIDAEADMTPEEVLAKLNSSFTQGNVVLNGAGSIIAYNGSPSIPNRDFVLMDSGRLTFRRWRDGAYEEYKGLKRVEYGEAASAQTIILPGWWDTKPKVIVSPLSLRAYDVTYATQSQSWACRAEHLREEPEGSGIYKFNAVAELTLSSNQGTTVINQTSGSTSADSWTSSEYAVFTNTSSLTANVSALSVKGTGAHTHEYYYRKVVAYLQLYKTGVGWYDPPDNSITLAIGPTTTAAQTGSITVSGLTDITHMRVYYVASNVDGTVFSLGADTYTPAGYAAVSGTGVVTCGWGAVNTHYYGSYTFPALTLPSGSIITWVSYYYSIRAQADSGGHHYNPNGNTYAGARSGDAINKTTDSNCGSWALSVNEPVYQSCSYGSASFAAIPLHVYTGQGPYIPGSGYTHDTYQEVTGGTAYVYYSTLNVSSTTPANTYNLTSFNWELSGSQALAVGSLNWIAVGE
jgi:hypothetical protein